MFNEECNQVDEELSVSFQFQFKSDSRNPHNWSMLKRTSVVVTTMLVVLNSSMGSSLTGNAIPYITKEFAVQSQVQSALPMSMFLVGYVFGPIAWAPLSEEYGRRPIVILTFPVFTLFTMSCALAPTWSSFLGFRLLTGIFGSAIVALGPGIIADIYDHPTARGWCIAVFMAVTGFGPMLGPIVSGFASPAIGWRWAFWIGLIVAGTTFIFVLWFPETHGPTLMARYAPKGQILQGPQFSKRDLHWRSILSDLLLRPLYLLFTEPVVATCSVYLALCYSIFYMSFEVFPYIFKDVYSLSPGQCGLVQLTIGAGCVLALPIYWIHERMLTRFLTKLSRPSQELLRLPLACLGGPLFVVSLFWLGWSSQPDIPFAVPMMAGIPFGIGFMCIFIGVLNYMTDAYGLYAASANAASSCSRSFFATFLPLAGYPMLSRLGISGTCSLLGGLSALISIIPFVLIWKGGSIRARSRFCIALKSDYGGAGVGFN